MEVQRQEQACWVRGTERCGWAELSPGADVQQVGGDGRGQITQGHASCGEELDFILSAL